MVKQAKKSDKNPLVSVVILNWNGAEDTVQCLKSLSAQNYSNIETIVVDNGSIEPIQPITEYTDLPFTLVKNKKNLGFTGGEIVGLKHCHGEYILILNNDAIIDVHAIERALKTFKTDPTIAAVGGRTYLLDDNGNKMGMFHYSHQSVDPLSAEVTTFTKDNSKVQDVTTISGACVLIKREAIKKYDYFDSEFFAYYEETDLFSRFRRAGLRVVFDPSVIIWHKMGASTRNKKYFYNYLMYKNQFLFAYKNFDTASLKIFKRIHRRHFLRALSIRLKHLGRLTKDDMIHKARVDAYIKGLMRRTTYRKLRHATQNLNPAFNLNDLLFTDNPLPVSMLIDATAITEKQAKTLQKNLQIISTASTRPSEIIIVSKKPLTVPSTDALVRIENIVDKGIFNYTPYDLFFMTSNNDMLLFGNEQTLDKYVDEITFSKSLRALYTDWSSNEAHAIVTSTRSGNANLSFYRHSDYSIVAVKKSALVSHVSEHMYIMSVTIDTITDTIGRSLAQGLAIRTIPDDSANIYGVQRGKIDYQYEPILTKPFLWWIKRTLTRAHIWGISAKVIRKLGRIVLRESKTGAEAEAKTNTGTVRYSKDFPVIINTRDRYDPLMKLVAWLEHIGHKRIVFVDNDSSYPPLLEYFRSTKHQVLRLGRNGMHKSPWESMAVRFSAKDSPYILTDPDVIPVDTCPDDVFETYVSLLNKYPDINKVGFGLKINDIPDHFAQKQHVLEWETRYWSDDILAEPDVYKADVDTTMALYRPHTWWFLANSLRTGGDCVVRHEPWYQDSMNPTEDFMYYRMRASREVSTWGLDSLPKHHMRALKKEGYIDDFEEEDE